MEALAAVLAGVGSRVRVDEQMSGEGGGALEHLPTHLTAKTTLLKGTNTFINKLKGP